MYDPNDDTIDILEALEWKERACLTLRALENYNTRQIGYCLNTSTALAWILSNRTHRAVRKLLQSRKTRWDTPEAFLKSLELVLEKEVESDY